MDGLVLTNVSLHSLWFPGLLFWLLSEMAATLARPHSQKTSTHPMTFQKEYSKEIWIFPCNFFTTILTVIHSI